MAGARRMPAMVLPGAAPRNWSRTPRRAPVAEHPSPGQVRRGTVCAMSWLRNMWSVLVSYVDAYGNVTPTYQRTNLRFLGAGVSVVDNPSKQSTDVTIPGTNVPGQPLAGISLALGGQTPPQVQVVPQTTKTTTNASTVTLGTVPVAAGAGGRLRCVVVAKIAGANSTSWVTSVFEAFAPCMYPTGGSLATPGGTPITASCFFREPLFAVSGGGQLTIAASGSNLVITATGPNPSNVQAAYSNSLAVVALGPSVASGICVVSNGGNLYLVTTGGTTVASGAGPTGTGSAIAEGGASTVVYSYLGPAAAGIVVQWTLALAELISG